MIGKKTKCREAYNQFSRLWSNEKVCDLRCLSLMGSCREVEGRLLCDPPVFLLLLAF